MSRIIRRTTTMTVQDIVSHVNQPSEEKTEDRFFVHTGMTLWNLALSDRADGGFLLGKVVNVIGDTSSGKTFLSLGLLAECAQDPRLEEYDLIHDDSEFGNEFDLVGLFGQKAADRILPPGGDKQNPEYSREIMDFEVNVRRRLKAKKPFIYVLDSLDALTTKEELAHAKVLEEAHIKGVAPKGTYGMEKAKQLSILLRILTDEIKQTKSLLIIVSQTRDNIDPMSFQPKTRAGGKALAFYCSYEMWTAVAKKIMDDVGAPGAKKKKVGVGVICRMKITKDRCTGKVREVNLPIYFNYGADDTGSCVDYLEEEGIWVKNEKGGTIDPKGFASLPPGSRDKLIKSIESKGAQESLRKLVEKSWHAFDKALATNRKPKYE